MSQADVFNTATWNFLMGDRAVEDILKDKRLSKITVRGGIGTVLPTLAAIKDISRLGWKDPVEASLYVPANSLSLHRPALEKEIEEKYFYETLLRESFGVQIWNNYCKYDNQLIIVMDMTEENRPDGSTVSKVLNVLKNGGNAKTIFTCPGKEKLLPHFRPYAQNAWSTIYWDGLNAFFSSKVEEAVKDANPNQILVMGAKEENIFYTAIGAADYFIIEDSQFRDPASLELWDIIEMGKKVSVISNFSNDKNSSKTLNELVLKHLNTTLKIDSTMADYSYTTVNNHKIMIDII